MKAATLQEFLRKLSAPLDTLGVAQPSLAALGACADALEPFKKFELAHLADVLHRADEAVKSGLPVVEVPGVAPISTLAMKLGEDVHGVGSVESGEAEELEKRINLHRHQFQSAITELAQQFGITVECSETPNWVGLVRARKLVETLKPLITTPESYREPSVEDGRRRLMELGDPVLKQLAIELGVTIPKGAKGKGAPLVEEILAHVTTHRPASDKPVKAPKAAPDLTEPIRVLKEDIAKVKQDPHALTDEQVEEIMTNFKKFKLAEMKVIVLEVMGVKVSKADDAVLRIRSALMGVRQQIDSQNA
jgi:hypothetical protein